MLAALLLAPAGAWAGDLDLSAPAPTPADFAARWGGWGGIGGYYGTDQSSYGVLSLFLPLAQTPDSLFFTQIDGKYFDGDVLEGNLAAGLRRMTDSGFNLGIWTGLDVRKSASDNVFGQVSGGLEALSEHFDARFNGYWPLTGPQGVDGAGEVVLEGNNIFMVGGGEVAMYGVDGEVGLRLPFAGNGGHLAVYGGGFWFDHDDVPEAIAGPKARVELAFNDIAGPGSRLTGEYEYSHDNVRGDRHQVGARLRIPLGPTPPAPAVSQRWLRMTDAIERDTDIVIGGSGEEPVEDAITDVDFDQVVMTSAVDTDDLQTVLNDAGGNRLIIADGTDGTIGGNAALSDNQTLQGGGSTIQVRGLTTGAIGSFTAPGTRPTIDFDGNFVLRVANRDHLAGLNITGAGSGAGNLFNNGVRGAAGILAAFTDLDVSGVGDAGFDFFDADNAIVDFRNVTVSGAFDTGIDFTTANGADVDFTNVWVSDTGDAGFDFFDAVGATVDFNHVQVSNTGFYGMDFVNAAGAKATFSNVTFAGTIGNSTDALIRSIGTPLPEFNGDIVNNADNIPPGDLCQGDFTGTLTFTNGVTTVITDGVSCAAISDRRLKRDIRPLMTRADGLRLYAFRYLWSDTEYIGVMAQDLAGDERFADAAMMTPAGFYVVDYGKLGLRMTTLDAWRAIGPAAVSLPHG